MQTGLGRKASAIASQLDPNAFLHLKLEVSCLPGSTSARASYHYYFFIGLRLSLPTHIEARLQPRTTQTHAIQTLNTLVSHT